MNDRRGRRGGGFGDGALRVRIRVSRIKIYGAISIIVINIIIVSERVLWRIIGNRSIGG